MITRSIEKYLDRKSPDYNDILNLAKPQKYIREENGISSVSLREVRRFVILIKWFMEYFKIKKENKDKIKKKYQQEFTQKEIMKRSIILSILLCYYLCLPEKVHRKVI